jgi:hypothetical protein
MAQLGWASGETDIFQERDLRLAGWSFLSREKNQKDKFYPRQEVLLMNVFHRAAITRLRH